MIHAFSCYVTNVYPEALKLYKSIDSLSKQILKGEPCSAPNAQILAAIDSYTQVDEKERSQLRNWVVPSTYINVMKLLF
jgi:hypothetical protein